MPAGDGGPHLLHVFPSFAVGGPQVRFTDIANRLAGKYRHTVISLDGAIDCASRLASDATVRLMPLAARKSSGLDLGNLRHFRRLLGDIRPDVLLTYNWGAVEWALANRWFSVAQHIHFEDGFGPEESTTQLRRRLIFRRLAFGAHTTLVVPSLTLQRLATQTWRFKPAKVIRIPNGIDCERFVASRDKPACGTTVIGTVGALRAEKNFARLIRCVAAMPSAFSRSLVIAGDGPERDRLENAALACGLAESVEFMGAMDRPERLMKDLDIFALSSDTEQMPYAVIEAMAARLPVVATDVGDIRAMVAKENRPFIVARDDEAGFAAALDRLAADAALRRRLGSANRTRAIAEFDLNKMCERYDDLFSASARPLHMVERGRIDAISASS